MSTVLNAGVIGVGVISGGHLEAYKTNKRARLHSICDIDAEWLPDAEKIHKPERAFLNYHEMLADPKLDAVSICLPTALHAQATIDALEAGKHVLCEKPMALNADEARAMKAAAVKSGKKLMISHNQRLEGNIIYLKELQDQGYFGDIYLMRIGWRRPMGILPPAFETRPNGKKYNRNFFNEKDNGGGVLRDLGSHLLDLSLHITGFPAPVTTVSSLYRKFYNPDVDLTKYPCDSEDMAVAQIIYDNGLTMQLEFSFASHVAEDTVLTEIYGTKAGASRRGQSLKLIESDKNGTVIRPVSYPRETKFPQACFIDAVLDDTDVPITADEGIRVIEVLDSIYNAAGVVK